MFKLIFSSVLKSHTKMLFPIADFIAELASDHFLLNNRFSYALRNHSIQYGFWNGDGIKQEHLLVMKPK